MNPDKIILYDIPIILFLVCFTLVITINLLLIKPILKKDKNLSINTILSLFLIFADIISCFHLGMQLLYALGYNLITVVYILYSFYLIPPELSALNLLIHSFFKLTNNHFFCQSKKQPY